MEDKKRHNYVDNKTFYKEICIYKERQSKSEDGEKIQLTPILADSIVLIGQRLLNHRNFKNYNIQVKDEMLGDGIENCLRYFDNYNIKYENPFAYFTQITWFAFIRRIKKEYAEQNGKTKYSDYMDNDDSFHIDNHDKDMKFTNSMLEFEKNKDQSRYYD